MTLSNPPDFLSATAAIILANPAPVLALDACAVLDMLRSQHRLQTPPRLIEMAIKAVQASTATPRRLHIVLVEQVEAEYRKHVSNELRDLARHFQTLSQTGSTLLQQSQIADWQAALSAIEASLSSLPDTLIAASLKISHDAACLARARWRLANGAAPGRRGSGNVADCVIVEHVLELSRQLKAGGFAQPQVFASSNVKDFGPVGQPKPPLDSEFAALGIDYFPDIEAAAAVLRL